MALPNGPMEIVFSFDTTGSMSGCLNEVRGRVSDMVQRLQADIPGIKMAVFAHGDYCDISNYVTKWVDFNDDVTKLVDFTQNVSSTGGGDSDECYELVLHQVRTQLSWTPGSQRALVLIGDCNPHEPNYPDNRLKLDWRVEADKLGKMGVRIYSVQCHSYGADKFYAEIARCTDGQHLKLNDFKNIFDFLMTVCYKERGDDLFLSYEKEVRARSAEISKDLHNLFGNLRDKAPKGITTMVSSTCSVIVPKKKLGKGGKTIKASKKVKDTLKSIKKSVIRKDKKVAVNKKYLEKFLPKLRRENVPETNFMLREMPWSDWQLVCAPPKDERGVGYRAERIFNGKTDVQALYEIGVQPKSRKKYAVYSKLSDGFEHGINWDTKLFGRKDIVSEIDNVCNNNCSVYLRRLVIKGDKCKEKVRHALRKYDYAWRGVRSVRRGHRSVVKGGVEISSEMEI